MVASVHPAVTVLGWRMIFFYAYRRVGGPVLMPIGDALARLKVHSHGLLEFRNRRRVTN